MGKVVPHETNGKENDGYLCDQNEDVLFQMIYIIV